MSDSSARTIHCSSCGSSFELSSLSEVVACAHCGHEQVLDEALLQELRRYEASVGSDLEQARAARDLAATWESMTDRVKRSTRPGSYLLAFALIGGLPTAVSVIGMLLMEQGVIPRERVDIVAISAQVAAFVGIGAYFAIYVLRKRRLRAESSSPVSSSIRCPDCGAPNEIPGGEALEDCQYCGGSLMPSKDVRERVVDAAREEARRALMERYRAERSGYAVYSKVGLSTTAQTIFIGGSFLLMIGVSSVAFSIQMVTGAEPYNPAIFGLWGATLAIIVVMIAIIRHAKSRARSFADAVRSLARASGGDLLGGVEGATQWLNTYWAGPINPMEMFPGKYYQSASLRVRGYEVFFDVNSVPLSNQHRAYCRLIVPCDPPDPPAPGKDRLLSEQARLALDRVRSLGFPTVIEQGGLIARGDEDVVERLKKPENIGALAEPITAMVKLAEALGAPPTGPVPF